jgi:hypothetical protein
LTTLALFASVYPSFSPLPTSFLCFSRRYFSKLSNINLLICNMSIYLLKGEALR